MDHAAFRPSSRNPITARASERSPTIGPSPGFAQPKAHDNGFALRNLAAILLQSDHDHESARQYLLRAVTLLPNDQQAWLGLAQAQMANGEFEKADESLQRCVAIQPHSPYAEMAKSARSTIAQNHFRKKASGSTRPDAVMYYLGALQKFSKMTPSEVRAVGFEIATLGMKGIDVNASAQKYKLRSLPGNLSGLHLLCYEYVAFK